VRERAHTIIAGVQPLAGRHEGEPFWHDQLLRGVEAVPGVVAASSAAVLPLAGELPQAVLRRQGEPLSAARDAYMVGAGR
jgi:hypothetical protein